jgi:PAS domain S-box-containing protein
MVATAGHYSVLVVEDNEDLVMGLQDLLHHDGYAVIVTGTVAGAIELVRTHRFNAIILDLGLPDGDGINVLKESQNIDPSLPVMIVTAHISIDRTVEALAKGAYAYLTKPYDREELRHTLRRAIGVKELAVKIERTEQLLNKSEERLSLVIQGSNDGFWDGLVLPNEPWSSPRTPVWWSPRVKAMLGYTDEEFPDVLESWASRLHPEDADRVFAALTGHIERRYLYDVEYRLRTKSGAYDWFRARGQAIWDETGQAVRMSGSLQCVTDRKRAEDALHRNEQLLRNVADNTTAVIYVKDIGGRFLFINHRFEQLFHLTTEQIIGHTNHEIFPREIADAFRANDLHVLQQNSTVEYEEQAPQDDGLHTYLSIKFPLCDHTGTPYATCGISTDITGRKRTEEELRQSEERFRTMFTQAPIGMALIDSLTGHIYESNAKFAQAAGRTTEEMRSLDWMSITHPDDVQADLNNMAKLNAGEIAGFQMEKRYVHPDGTVAWINLTVAPIQVEEHTGPRHLAMIEDITERKAVEHNLRSLTNQLHLALASTELGMWNWDIQADHIYWSSQVDRLLGLSVGSRSCTKKDWLALVYEEDRESVAGVMRQAIDQAGANLTIVHRVMRQNGGLQWCIWTGEIIRDHDGKALHILGTVRTTAGSNP